MSSPSDMAPPPILASYTAKGFGGRLSATLYRMWLYGMLVLFASIALGVPPLFAVPLFIAAMVWIMVRRAGWSTYELTPTGIRRRYRSFLAGLQQRPEENQAIRFSEIRWFRLEKDLTGSLHEIETLTLKLDVTPFSWRITDQHDPAAFRTFCTVFLQKIEEHNTQHPAFGGRAAIPRRPGFYRSLWGKILGLIFTGLSIGLIGFALAGLLDFTGLFRLAFLLVPGTLYMLYRSWVKRP